MATRFGVPELDGYLACTPRDAGPQEIRVRAAMREWLASNSGPLENLPPAEMAVALERRQELFADRVAAGGEVSNADRGSVITVVNEVLRAAGEPNRVPVPGHELSTYVDGLYERARLDGGDELAALRRVKGRLSMTDLKIGDSRDMVIALRDERTELVEGLTVPQQQAMTGIVNHLSAVRTDPAPMRDPRGQDVLDYAKQRLEGTSGDERQAIGRAVELLEQQPGLMAATDLALRAEFLDQSLDESATNGLTEGQAESLRGFLADLAAKTEDPVAVTSRTSGTEALRAEVRRAQEPAVAGAEGLGAGRQVTAPSAAATVAKFVGDPAAATAPGREGSDGARDGHRAAVRTRAAGTVRSQD